MTAELLTLALVLNCFATFALTGVIWIVQTLHYPSMVFYDRKRFTEAHRFHTKAITPVVAPLMIAELLTSSVLAITPFPQTLSWLFAAGLALTAITWVSTFLLQAPIHSQLARGFDDSLVRRLVRTNIVRTAAWSAHALICAVALSTLISARL
ncbi:MAG: hypothetical protein J5I65_05450 [Aridibacter famidurans]|nr:hypothetical protein [Aridibacter famidurans]